MVSYERRDYKVSHRHSSVTSVAIMRWNSEERAFAVEAYSSSGCSVIALQRAFRNDLADPVFDGVGVAGFKSRANSLLLA